MRQLPSTEPKFTGQPTPASGNTLPANALAHSALQMTRAAIARWRGTTRSPATPARDLRHISPQARWLAQARMGLDSWIAQGGFAQVDLTESSPLPASVMHNCTPTPYSTPHCIDACID